MILKLLKLCKKLNKHNHILCFSTQSSLKPPWNVLFFGTDEFSIFSLKALVKEYRRGQTIHRLEVCTSIKKAKNVVQTFAENENLIVKEWPASITKDEYHVGLVVSFGHLIPLKIINKFPMGMINVHASLLPRWRGAAPIIYSLANGDKTTGISIMQIKPKKFDTGEILCQRKVEIEDEMYMPELHSKLGELGASELIACLNDLPKKLKEAKPQLQENISYAPKIDSSFACVNWSTMSSIQVYNLERALKGVMPVTSTWNGETIKLINIRKSLFENDNINEGAVIYDNNNQVLQVVCADKKYVSIEKVQVFRKKIVSAKDFNNGYLRKTPVDKRFFL